MPGIEPDPGGWRPPVRPNTPHAPGAADGNRTRYRRLTTPVPIQQGLSSSSSVSHAARPFKAALTGLEPAPFRSTTGCAAFAPQSQVVDATGIEPATFRLSGGCTHLLCFASSSQPRIRTWNLPRVKRLRSRCASRPRWGDGRGLEPDHSRTQPERLPQPPSQRAVEDSNPARGGLESPLRPVGRPEPAGTPPRFSAEGALREAAGRASGGGRTRDLLIGNQALHQQSFGRTTFRGAPDGIRTRAFALRGRPPDR
jgi:hypothetical protein